MPMPNVPELVRPMLKPNELEGESFAYAAWNRFKSTAKPGWDKRLTAQDFCDFLDAVYDQYQDDRKVRGS